VYPATLFSHGHRSHPPYSIGRSPAQLKPG
jgi:hypothetical protein